MKRQAHNGRAQVRQLLFQSCHYLILDSRIPSSFQDMAHRLGFALLLYSYAPTGLPTPVCANVVEREI